MKLARKKKLKITTYSVVASKQTGYRSLLKTFSNILKNGIDYFIHGFFRRELWILKRRFQRREARVNFACVGQPAASLVCVTQHAISFA
jgi:hypothetical protein